MKRILLLFVAFSAVLSLNAQVLFSHDFEDGTLGELSIVDNDGNTPATNVAAFADAWTVTENPNLGEGTFAVSNSWYAPAAAADDWLITPALTIPEAGYGFSFDIKAQDPQFADGYEVLVSTTDMELESFDAVFTIAAEETDFKKRIIGLDDYVGETIHLAIRNNSFDKFLLVVDNLEVKKIKQFDVAGVGITNKRWELVGTDGGVTLMVENQGAQELTSFDVELTIDGTTTMENITGVSIAPFSTGEVTVGAFSVSEARNYDISYVVSNPNGMMDEDDTNNEADGQIGGLTSVPSRMAVGEEGTGAWCGWCPRGHVFMEEMKEDHADEFIGIAVHVGDIMEIEGYAGDELGYGGYPSAHMNRERINIDPSEFPANMDVTEERVPFEVNVEVSYDESTREVTAVTTVTSRSQLAGDYRLSMIMTEDHVQGTTAAYNQANYYSGGASGPMGGYETLPDPVPAQDMIYEDVARAIIGSFNGVSGSVPAEMDADASASYTFTYTIPEAFDPTQMQAVVLLTNTENGAIVNAAEDIVQMPVNVFETPELIDAVLKPNPTSDITYMELNLEEASEVSLQVIDLSGKVVMSRNYGTQQGIMSFPINVQDLTNGVYMVKVNSANGIATQRLVVSK